VDVVKVRFLIHVTKNRFVSLPHSNSPRWKLMAKSQPKLSLSKLKAFFAS